MSGSNRPVRGTPRREESPEDESASDNQPPVQGLSGEQVTETSTTPRQPFFQPLLIASRSVTRIQTPRQPEGVGSSSHGVQTYRPSEVIPTADEPQVIQGSQRATGRRRRAAVTRPMATNTSTVHITDADSGRLMFYEETTTVYSEISVVEALENEDLCYLLVNLLYRESIPVLDKTIQFVSTHAPRHLRKLISIRKERDLASLGDTQGVPQHQPPSLSRPQRRDVAVQVSTVASGLLAAAAEEVHLPSMSSSSVISVSAISQLPPVQEQPSPAQRINLFDQPSTSTESSTYDSSSSGSSSATTLFRRDSPPASSDDVHTQVSGSCAVPICMIEPNFGEGMLRQSRHYLDLSSLPTESHLELTSSSYSETEYLSARDSSASLPSSVSFTSEETQLTSSESGPSHSSMAPITERIRDMIPLAARLWKTYPTQQELQKGKKDYDVTSLDKLLVRQAAALLTEAQVETQGQKVTSSLEVEPKSADHVRQESSTPTRRVIAPDPLLESAAHHSRTDSQARPSLKSRTVHFMSPDPKPEVKATRRCLSGVERQPSTEETTGREEPTSPGLQRTFSLSNVLETSPAEGGREDLAYLYGTVVHIPPSTQTVQLGGSFQSRLELPPRLSQDVGERSIATRAYQRSTLVVRRTLSDSTIYTHEIQPRQSASVPSIVWPVLIRSNYQQLHQIREIITQDIRRFSMTGVASTFEHISASLQVLQEPSLSSVADQATHLPDPSVTLIQSSSSLAVLPSSQQPVIAELLFENRSIIRDSTLRGEQGTLFVSQSYTVLSTKPTESVSQSRTLSTNEIEVMLQRVNYDVTRNQELETAQSEELSSASSLPTDNIHTIQQSTDTSSGVQFPVEFWSLRSASQEVHSSSTVVAHSETDAQSGGTYSVPSEEAHFVLEDISTVEISPRRLSDSISDEELFAVGDSSGVYTSGARVRHMSIFGEGAAGFDQGVGTNLSRSASLTTSVGERTDERLRRQTAHQTVPESEQLERPGLKSPTTELLPKIQVAGGENSESSGEAEAAGHPQGVELSSYQQEVTIITNRELHLARRKLLQSMAEYLTLVDTGVPKIKYSKSACEVREDEEDVTSNEPLLINVDSAGSTSVYELINSLLPIDETNGFFLEESRGVALAGFVGELFNDDSVLVFIQDNNDSIVVYLHDSQTAIIVLNDTEGNQRTISTINDACVIKFLRRNISIIINAFEERISGLREFVVYLREMMMSHPYSVENLNFHHSGDYYTYLPVYVLDSAALLMGSLIEGSCICLTLEASTIIYPNLDSNTNFTKAGIQTIMGGETIMINLTDTESDSLDEVLSSSLQQIQDKFSQSNRLRHATSSLIHTAACLISSRPISLKVKRATDGRRLIMITKGKPYADSLNETQASSSVESQEKLQAEGRSEKGYLLAQSAIESEESLLSRSSFDVEDVETYESSSQITEPGSSATKPPIERHRTSQVEEISSHTSDSIYSRPRSPTEHARRPSLSHQQHDRPKESIHKVQAASSLSGSDVDTYEIILIKNVFEKDSIAGYIVPDHNQLSMFLLSIHKTLIFFQNNDGFTTVFLSSNGTGVILHEDTTNHKRMISKLANRELYNFLKEEIIRITGSSGLVSTIQAFINNICEIQQQMPHLVEPLTSVCSANQPSGLLHSSLQEELISQAQAGLQLLVSIGNHTLYSKELELEGAAVAELIHADFTIQSQLMRSKYNRIMAEKKLENLVTALLYVSDSLGATQQAEVSQSPAASFDQPIHSRDQRPSLVRLARSAIIIAEPNIRPNRVGSCELVQIPRSVRNTGYFVSHDEYFAGVYTCSNYDAQLCFQDSDGVTSLYVNANKNAVIIHETTNKQRRFITPVRDSTVRVSMLRTITNLSRIPSGQVEGMRRLTGSIKDLVWQLPHIVEGQHLYLHRSIEEISQHLVRRSLSMDYVIGTASSVVQNVVETMNLAFGQYRQIRTLHGLESPETVHEQRALARWPKLTGSIFRKRIKDVILYLEDLMKRIVVQQPLRAPLPRPTSDLRLLQEILPSHRIENFPRSSQRAGLPRHHQHDQTDQSSGKLVNILPETTEIVLKYEVISDSESNVHTGSEIFVSVKSDVEQDTLEVEITDVSSALESESDVSDNRGVQIHEQATANIPLASLRRTGSIEILRIVIPELQEAVAGYLRSSDESVIGTFFQQYNGYTEFIFKNQVGSTSVYLHREKLSMIICETEEPQKRIVAFIDDQGLEIDLLNYISIVTLSAGSKISGLSKFAQAVRDLVNVLPIVGNKEVKQIYDFLRPLRESRYLEGAVSTVPLSIQNLIKAKSRILCSPEPVLASITPEYQTTVQQTRDDSEVCEADVVPHVQHLGSTEVISIHVPLEPEGDAGYFVLEDGETFGIFYNFKETTVLFINDKIGGTVLYLQECLSGMILHEMAESHEKNMCNFFDEEICGTLKNDLSTIITTSGGYVSGLRALISNIRSLLFFNVEKRKAKKQISERSPSEQELMNHAAAALESLIKVTNSALSPRVTQMGNVTEIEESFSRSQFEIPATSEMAVRSEHVNFLQTAASIMLNLHAEISNLQVTDKEKEKQVPQDTISCETEAYHSVQSEPQDSQLEQIIPKSKPQRPCYRKLKFSKKEVMKEGETVIQPTEVVSKLSPVFQDSSNKPSTLSTCRDSETEYTVSSVYHDALESQSLSSVYHDAPSGSVFTTPREQPCTSQQELVAEESPMKEATVTPAISLYQAVEISSTKKSAQLEKISSTKGKIEPAGSQMKGAIKKEKTPVEPQREAYKKLTSEKVTQHLPHKVLQKERTLEKSTKDKPKDIPVTPAELQQQGAIKKPAKQQRKPSMIPVVPPEKQGAIKKTKKPAPPAPEQQAVVPEQQAAVPEQQAAVPEQQAAVPEQQAAVAEQQAVSVLWKTSEPIEFFHPPDVSVPRSPDRQLGPGRTLDSELKLIYDECFKHLVDVRLRVNDIIFIRQSQLLICCEEGMFYYDINHRFQMRLLEGFTNVQRLFFTYDFRYSSYLLAMIEDEISLVQISNEDLLKLISNLNETAASQVQHLARQQPLTLPFKTIKHSLDGAVMNKSSTFLGYYSGNTVYLTELEGIGGGILTDRDIQSSFKTPVRYLDFIDDRTVVVYAGKFYILPLDGGRAFFPLLPASAALQEIIDIIYKDKKSFMAVLRIIDCTEMEYLICVGDYAFRVDLTVAGFITQRYYIPGMRSAELFGSSILRVLQGNCIAYYDLKHISSKDIYRFVLLTVDCRALLQIIHCNNPRLVRAQHGVQPEIECVVGTDRDFDVIVTLNNGLVLHKLNLLSIHSKFLPQKDLIKLTNLTELYKTIQGEEGSGFQPFSDLRTRKSKGPEEKHTEYMTSSQDRAGYEPLSNQFVFVGLSGLVDVPRHIQDFQELRTVESLIQRNVSILERAQRYRHSPVKKPLADRIEALYMNNLNYLRQIKAVREKLRLDPRSAAYIFPVILLRTRHS